MSGHTPGPWRVEEGTTLVWGRCDPDDRSTYGMGYPIASCEMPRSWSPDHRPDEAEREANARLIAAAPEMYELIEQFGDTITDMFEQMLRGHWVDDHGHDATLNIKMMALKRLIFKAAYLR